MAEGILSVGDGGRDVATYDTDTDGPMTLVGEGSPGDALVVQSGFVVRPQTPGGGGSVGDVSREGVTVDNRIARWHGTDAEVQSSVVSINDDGNISGYGTLTGGALGTQLVDSDGLLRILAIGQNGAADRQAMLWDDGGSAWIVSDILEPGMVDISADTNLAADAPIVLTDDTLSHAASGVDADTYTSLTVDALGHVTGGSNPGHVLGAGTGTAGTIPLWDPDNNTLGDSALTQIGSDVTAAGQLAVQRSALGSTVILSVANLDATDAGSDAQVEILTSGPSSGDPYVLWSTVVQSYTLGIDNSDSGTLVGSIGGSLGTANWLEVTTARAITLDAASGQTVSLAVNSTEELQVSDAEVTVLTNDFIVAVGDAEITAGNLGVGMAPVDAIHVSGASGGITVTETDSAFDAVVISSGAAEGIIDVFVSATIKQVHLQGFGNCWVNSSNGNFGVGTDDPTLLLDVNAKGGITPIGGIAIKLKNKTGGNTVAGQLVEPSAGTTDAFDTGAVNSLFLIGVVLEAGVADGSEAWIVISGIADVLMSSAGAARNDRIGSGATGGSADIINSPSLAEHFREVGHVIASRVGAGLTHCILHFN